MQHSQIKGVERTRNGDKMRRNTKSTDKRHENIRSGNLMVGT